MLLEREPPLRAVAEFLAEAAAGHGRLVFLGGEAGVGKTTFVGRVMADAVGVARVGVGACDGSSTPAPLGPLVELLPVLPEGVWPAGAARHEVFARLAAALQQPEQPYLLVVEDLHWSDEATLDLVRYLGRRVHRLRALVLVTYRREETTPEHPLRVLLGDLATGVGVRRVDLRPLSVEAVRSLASAAPAAGAARDRPPDPEELHRVTGGNPFFVTEVLAAGTSTVPRSVQDAVLARASRLGPAARQLLDLVALAGPRTEPHLFEALAPGSADALDEALARDVLRLVAGALVFRHELARLVVEQQVPALRRIALHRAVLAHLESEPGGEPARMAYHADAAGLTAAVLRHAPDAAARAASLGAHREAAEQYRRALRHADGEPDRRRAELLGLLSYECYLTDRLADAVTAREQALATWTRLGDRVRVGDSHRALSRLQWFSGRKQDAERHAAQAVEALAAVPSAGADPGPLAMAYSNQAQLLMLAGDLIGTRHWVGLALELLDRSAASATNLDVRVHALNNLGAAELSGGDEVKGRAMLTESLELARQADLHEHAARAWTNLATDAVNAHRLAEAAVTLQEGIGYCLERDLDPWVVYMQGWRARLLLNHGDAPGAAALAERLLREPRLAPFNQVEPLAVLARARARAGREDWQEPLDRAVGLARQMAEAQRLAPVAVARCEIAWIAGDPSAAEAAAVEVWPVVRRETSPWTRGSIATWLPAGADVTGATDAGDGTDAGAPAPPYAAEVAGRWAEAAGLWQSLQTPFARGLALARGGTREGLSEAAAVFDHLGAVAAAARARAQSRAAGWAPLRRRSSSTRSHPAGLTRREAEVLPLLAQGLPDAAIAERLVISRRTAEHHVASILGKLGLSSRQDVAVAAERYLGTGTDADG